MRSVIPQREVDRIIEEHLKWKPDDWKGTLEGWREIVTLEYVLSQGYGNDEDDKRYRELHNKGWFGKIK